MVSSKLKLIWQHQGFLRAPWQRHRASPGALLQPLPCLSADGARGPVGVEETLEQYWVCLFFLDSLLIPKAQMSCGGGDTPHASSCLARTVPAAAVECGWIRHLQEFDPGAGGDAAGLGESQLLLPWGCSHPRERVLVLRHCLWGMETHGAKVPCEC